MTEAKAKNAVVPKDPLEDAVDDLRTKKGAVSIDTAVRRLWTASIRPKYSSTAVVQLRARIENSDVWT